MYPFLYPLKYWIQEDMVGRRWTWMQAKLFKYNGKCTVWDLAGLVFGAPGRI